MPQLSTRGRYGLLPGRTVPTRHTSSRPPRTTPPVTHHASRPRLELQLQPGTHVRLVAYVGDLVGLPEVEARAELSAPSVADGDVDAGPAGPGPALAAPARPLVP